MAKEEKRKEVGALWEKQGPKARYMSGVIQIGEQKVSVVCFQNGFKKADKHPDWRVMLSEPRKE